MSADSLDSSARSWVVREDAGPLSPKAQAELAAWLDADPRHLGAYVRAKAAWSLLDRAQVLELPPPRARRSTARRLAILGGVIGLAAAAGVLALRPAVYASPLGQTRQVRLQDGSLAILDADSRIEARMALGERRIRLVRGEAWFHVAHDARHPFIVRVGPAQVRAVGTAFSVGSAKGGAEVIVTEGVVEARSEALPRPLRVAAGETASIERRHMRLSALPADALERQLAWREGRVGFNGDPLASAADRFNRYNRRQLVVENPELRRVSVVGWFKLDDPESFARAVAIGLHARIETDGDRIVIRRRDENVDVR